MKAHSLSLLAALTICFGSCQRRPQSTQDAPRMNVLYISLEDIGPFLGCYGWSEVKSPNLDAFAQHAVLFEDAHCQVALCTPSRTSILTGVRPTTSGITKIDDDWQSLLPEVTSLPRHFKDHGYYTHAVGKIYDNRCGGMDSAFFADESHRMLTNDRALAALETASNQQKPFFLGVGYYQVHTPWEPTSWGKRQYLSDSIGIDHMDPNFRGDLQTPASLRALIRDYYAFITDVDSLVGDLLASAEQMDMLHNTVVIVGALDHGFSLGWRGKWGKGNNYDMETQVPLMIRTPDNPNNGKRASGLVELVDIYPTLVDLCGLPAPKHGLEGYSLRGLLEDPSSPWKAAAFTTRAYHPDDFGIKTKEYTLVSRQASGIQLFDRRVDPINLNDISDAHPQVVKALLQLHKNGWQKAIPK